MPLRWIAVGLAFVLLDFRTESVDLVPDPFGWALIGFGAWRLAQVRTAWLAAVAALLGVADAALPYRHVRVDPGTGEVLATGDPSRIGQPVDLRFDPVVGWRLGAMALAMAVAGLTVWSLLLGLERRARERDATGVAGRLRPARWLVIGAWVVPYLVAIGIAVADTGRFDPIWNGNAEYVALVGLLVVAVLAALLAREGAAAWAQPDRPWFPGPWDAARLDRAADAAQS